VESKKNASSGFWTYANSFTYNAAGAVTSMQLGNGRWESTTFNSRLQPTQIALGATLNSDSLWKINYEFGELQTNGTVDTTKNNGNIGKETITVPTIGAVTGFTAVQSFSYDSLKRLQVATETVNSAQSWKQSFNYDRFGNRTFDAGNTTTIPTGCSTSVCNPTIDSTNNRISASQGYLYDANGNVTQSADNGKFVYDADNEIVEVRDATNNSLVNQYSFDGNGQRVKITVGGNTTVFVSDAFGKVIAEYSGETPPTSPKVNYITSDLLDSPRVITDENGSVTSRHDFTPFGEEISAGMGSRTTSQFYGGAEGIRQKFTGQQRDEDAKLDYFNARHYTYSIGRFMSADSFGGKISNPQTLNLYAYALNNPLKWVDPTGHFVDNPDDCKDSNGVERCTADQNNGDQVKKPNGGNYTLDKESVTVSGGWGNSGPSDQSWRDQGPPDLPDSPWDLAPVVGSGRRALYNMSCGAKGGCNISRATGYFIQTAVDAATIWKAGAELFAKEVFEETTEVGATKVLRNEAEEAPFSLYDDSITEPGSIRNIKTDVEPSKFISNLEENGFSRSASRDGAVINLEKDSVKYSVRPKAVGSKPPSADVFKNGIKTHKIRLP
jgi:RHS repeat-associated protein